LALSQLGKGRMGWNGKTSASYKRKFVSMWESLNYYENWPPSRNLTIITVLNTSLKFAC
jgi:hypothetical protein